MSHPFRTVRFLPAWMVLLMTACATQSPHPPNSTSPSPTGDAASPLRGKVIVLDPGHGGTAATDQFRVGPAGEREEWINLRVAMELKALLEARGARVLLTRTTDVAVELKQRALLAVDNRADVFLSIHHNATADRSVNFPIIYYHANASGNAASVALGKNLGRRIAHALYGRDADPPISVVSDHTIFPGSGAAVLRHSYGIPGVIGEASFFSNAEEEQRLKDPAYNRKEAEAYAAALEDFFAAPPPPVLDRYNGGQIPPLETLQEAERMEEAARRWREDFDAAEALIAFANRDSARGKEIAESETTRKEIDVARQKALDLYLRSARSFPDSPVARACHVRMAEILEAQGKPDEAALERRRVEEYYVPMK